MKNLRIMKITRIRFALTILCLASFLTFNFGDRLFVRAADDGTVAADTSTSNEQPPPMTDEQAQTAYGKLPLSFEANHGQTDAAVNFIARGAGYSLFLKPAEAVFLMSAAKNQPKPDKSARLTRKSSSKSALGKRETAVLRMKLVGAKTNSTAEGLEEQAGKVNYLVGSDESKWRTNISTFGRVKYEDVYAGIDMTYYGNQRQLEYDFVVAPKADYKQIRLKFDGAKKIEIEKASGDLLIHSRLGVMREHQPVVYQMINGERREIASRYIKRGKEIGFEVAEYDATLPLVIDPTLSYSTYLGGSDFDVGNGIAVDSSGNAYITGFTFSTNFPTTANAFKTNNGGGGLSDAFVTKLAANGQSLVYSTYLGGNRSDRGFGIAVDSTGSAYVTGDTGSTDFPTTANAFQTSLGGGGQAAFIAKISNVAPTAAAVSVGGRVTTFRGRGIGRAQITLTNAAGDTRTALTNAFGYFRFTELRAGETYIFTVKSKQYQFADNPQVLFVGNDLDDLNFAAIPFWDVLPPKGW